MENAVIDRFEGNLAVLLVGDAQSQQTVERSFLPLDANEGTWLKVTIENGFITKVEVDTEKTNSMAETIADKMSRLRRGDHLK